MSENKNNKNDSLSAYISGLSDQELKVLLLKLKNEIKKPDVSWERIKNILRNISEKDNGLLKDIMPLLLDD